MRESLWLSGMAIFLCLCIAFGWSTILSDAELLMSAVVCAVGASICRTVEDRDGKR